MPFIALTKPVVLPIAPLRQSLTEALPQWKWRCGDDDAGGAHDHARLDRPHTILGRNCDGMVMTAIDAHDEPLPPDAEAPPHRQHISLSPPSTDDADLAKRILILCGAALMIDQDADAHCQIVPGGPWYSTGDMRVALALCTAEGSSKQPVDHVLARLGPSGDASLNQPLSPTQGEAEPLPLSSESLPAEVIAATPIPFPRGVGRSFGRKRV